MLDSDGCCRFLHTGTCRQLFTIGGGDVRLSLVTVSASGRHLAAVTEDGLVLLYDVKVLCAELQKPPAPLVKAVTKPMKPKPKFKANISADSVIQICSIFYSTFETRFRVQMEEDRLCQPSVSKKYDSPNCLVI